MTGAEPRSWRGWAALGLGVLALLRMGAELAGWEWTAKLAAAWGISPRPKVFCDIDGHEPFTSRFVLGYTLPDGRRHESPISPSQYTGLKGPYNRRNAYGAALAYAPVLPEGVWRPVFCHGFRPGGPLRAELGIPESARRIFVRVETRTRGRDGSWTLEDPCAR
jgi:hypothetical protein